MSQVAPGPFLDAGTTETTGPFLDAGATETPVLIAADKPRVDAMSETGWRGIAVCHCARTAHCPLEACG